MPNLAQMQKTFTDALQSPGAQLPNFFKSSSTPNIGRRLDVYRNNVRTSLIDALAQTFPIVERLVGPEYFKSLAIAFLEDHLPSQGTLIGFGAEFPQFIEGRKELIPLPYLADVARLEHAWLKAYHAADVQSLTGDDLAAVSPDRTGGLSLELHPSVTLLSPVLPIFEIWKRNREEDHSPINLAHDAEFLLIARPQIDVIVTPIKGEEIVLLRTFNYGGTLSEAVASALQCNPSFDLARTLATSIAQGLFSSFKA